MDVQPSGLTALGEPGTHFLSDDPPDAGAADSPRLLERVVTLVNGARIPDRVGGRVCHRASAGGWHRTSRTCATGFADARDRARRGERRARRRMTGSASSGAGDATATLATAIVEASPEP